MNLEKCENMCFENALEKMRKNAKKCDEHIWKTSWEGGTLISFSSGLIFWGWTYCGGHLPALKNKKLKGPGPWAASFRILNQLSGCICKHICLDCGFS